MLADFFDLNLNLNNFLTNRHYRRAAAGPTPDINPVWAFLSHN